MAHNEKSGDPRTLAGAGSSTPPARTDDVPQRILELRQLVEESRIEEARLLLAELQRIASADASVVRWTKILGRGRVVASSPSSLSSIDDNAAWLRREAAQHRGQWVALRDGRLLASKRECAELHHALETRGELQDALFVHVGE